MDRKLVPNSFEIISPVTGTLMHELSALPVEANSLRIISYKYKKKSQQKGTIYIYNYLGVQNYTNLHKPSDVGGDYRSEILVE